MSKPAWINVGAQTSVGTATVAAASDELTITSHGLSDGDIVMADSLTGGADGPLIEGAVYFVRNAATDEFQLSATKGGALIEFATDGGADVYVAVPQYNAQELRRLDSALMFHGSSDRFGTRAGVRPGGSDAVSLSGTTWTVHNHSGLAYPGLTSLSGPYRYAQEEESDTLNPADGTNDRIDALDLQIQDDDEDSSGQRRSRVVYTAGTPAGTPSAPSVATNAFRLATILVSAGGSPSPVLTYVAPFTVAAGGVLPVRDSDELPSSGLHDGLTAFLQDLGVQVVRTGGGWTPAGRVQLDHTDLSGSVSSGTNLTVPTFLRGLFRSYTLEVDADVSVSLEPLVVRINGDSGTNYRASCHALEADSTVAADSDLGTTAFPRTGFLGEFGSLHVVTFRPRTLGDTGFVTWSTHGWANSGGSGSPIVSGGGRWNGTSQALASFTIRTTNTGDTWGSNSTATLWGNV